MKIKPQPKPWERQPEETPKQFEAFCVYRDLGRTRSQEATAEKLTKSRALISRWSSMNNWVDRVAEWDSEQDRLTRLELTKDIGAMRKRHADLANVMLIKAARALQRIPDDEIKPADVSRMVEVASKLERISRGDVGEVVEEREGTAAADPVQFYIPNNHRDDNPEDDEEEE